MRKVLNDNNTRGKDAKVALLKNRINVISTKILDSTPQLYYIEKGKADKTPKPLASSVLYASIKNHYLITAKHVYNHADEWDIGVLIKNVFYALEGTKFQTEDDTIDVAVLKLRESSIKVLLENYVFLKSSQIDENHHFIRSSSRYLEVGFPITRSKIKKHDKTIRVNPFILLSDIFKESNNHVYIDIPKTRKAFTDNIPIRSLPILTGLSGSGLWYISNFYRLEFKLVAIMIEWDSKNRKFTKGTKINLATLMIKEIEKT